MFVKMKPGLIIHQGGYSMATINPYINFNGNALEAFELYKSVFGGEFASIVRFKDLESADFPVPEDEADKIMRIVLPIGGNTLIANDVPEAMGRVNENENRSKISVSAESREEADKIFTGLSVGGTVEMPMDESPWGTYFAMFRDKFGIEWTVEFDPSEGGLGR
ncbi:VOC family protein [soil metagenome]